MDLEAQSSTSTLRRRKKAAADGVKQPERRGITEPDAHVKSDGTKSLKEKEPLGQMLSPKEAGLRSKVALSRVLLKQGHNELSLRGNFSSDSFNSFIDETTGLFTTFTVYRRYTANQSIYTAALVIYAVNAFVRIVIGLNAILSPAPGTQLVRAVDGSISGITWLRVIAGMLLIILEPVAGIRLLDSAFEPAPPLTDAQRKQLGEAKREASNVKIETAAKKKEASEKAKTAAEEMTVDATNELDDAARALYQQMADSRKQEINVVYQEAAYLELEAVLTQEETDLKFVQAELDKQTRSFRLEQKRLKGTELVEVVMVSN